MSILHNKRQFILYNQYVLHFADIMMLFFFYAVSLIITNRTVDISICAPESCCQSCSIFQWHYGLIPSSRTHGQWLFCGFLRHIFSSGNIRWWLDSSITKGKRSIMFDQSLRVKNAAGPWWEQRIPDASDLFFEEVSDPTASTQPTMLKSQTKLTWRVTQSLLSQRCLKSRQKGTRSAA